MNYKLLIIGQLPPPHHGSNVMTEIFIQSLLRLGHDITIVEKKFSKKLQDIGKLTIFKILKIPLITLILIYHLAINKYHMCFYFLSINPPSIIADAFFLVLIRIFRVKYVLYLHAKGIFDLNKKIVRPILRSFITKAISKSFGALVLGEKLKGDINHLIPKGRIFVLPNAVPDIKPNKIKNRHNKNGTIKILFLSNLIPSKGPMEFLKMARSVTKHQNRVQFILAGAKESNEFLNEIKNFIVNENLSEYVILTGAVYGENKEKLYEECDIFVFPTYYELETFGLVNLEAMRAGLPIVSSDEGSIAEVVIDGVNGFIIDPKDIDMLSDRVIKLITDYQLRIRMGKAGRDIFEKKFNINSYQKKLEQGLNFFLKVQVKPGSS